MKKFLSIIFVFSFILVNTINSFAIFDPTQLIYDINSGFFSTSGGWTPSATILGYEDGPTNYGYTEGWAMWKPELLFGGKYKVSIYNVVHSTNTSSVLVQVSDKNGIKNITYDNVSDPEGFINLGEFDFNSGTDGYVKIYSTGVGFVRLNCVKYELIEKSESTASTVPQTGEEEEYESYGYRSISAKNTDIKKTSENALKIYVKKGANGDGSESNPFGTIEQAEEKVKDIISAGYPLYGIGVYLMGGEYELEDTLKFTSQDSGNSEYPVVWQSYENEKVTFTAGKTINHNTVTKVTEKNILNRIPKQAWDNIYEINLTENSIGKIEPMNLRKSIPYVLVMGERAGQVSRWPNEGYGKTGDLIDSSSRDDSGPRKKGFTYSISDPRPLRWDNAKDIWLNGYWMTPYTIDYTQVARLDKDNMRISGKDYNGLGSYGNARYYAQNLLEEIDMPGEWYVDVDANKIYLYPYDGWENNSITFAYKSYPVVSFEKSSNVILKGIDIRTACGSGIVIDNSSNNCGVVGCSIMNVSGNGISIEGKNNYAVDCDISYTGAVGISVSGGDKYHLVRSDNYAQNNLVHNTGTGGGAKQGITINGCGNRVSDNQIYDIPTHGIAGGGMELTIENNVVERTNLEMGDTGAIYFIEYGAGYGSVIRNNLIRDSVGLLAIPGFSSEGALGIYLDDVTSGVEVYNNIIYNCKETGIFTHGGRNNKITNNILVNCESSIRMVKTGIQKSIAPGGTIETNIRKYAYDEEPLKSKYPQLGDALNDEFGEPKYNVLKNNVLFHSGKPDVSVGLSNNGDESGNLYFEEMAICDYPSLYNFDFSKIKSQNSGISEVRAEDIGIYTDEIRKQKETIVFDNRAEKFNLTYPLNNMTDVDPDVTLKWTLGKGGVRQYKIYISEDPQFVNIIDFNNTTAQTYNTQLDYGKTYYWRIMCEPMQGYNARWNDNGVFSFTTMSAHDKLQGEILSVKSLLACTQEGNGGNEFKEGSADLLKTFLISAQDALDSQIGMEDSILNLIKEKDVYLSCKNPDTKKLSTYVYDDYSLDTVGQRPLGLFFRSYSMLNVMTDNSTLESDNKMVKFIDSGEGYQFGGRFFDPQDKYLEVSSTVLPEKNDGSFSISVMKTGVYPCENGVYTNTAALVTFANNGHIYADKSKTFDMGNYTIGKYSNIRMKIFMNTKKYDVYVDGVLKAKDVDFDDQKVESVNQIVYHTTDGTSATVSDAGTFYFDNTIVRAPVTKGKNPYLISIDINGEILGGFEPDKAVYTTELTSQELKNAQITYKSGENAKVTVWKSDGEVYIAVINADFTECFTYLLKSKK